MAIIINRLIDCSLHERPRPTTHEERHPLGQVQDTFWMSHTELEISGSLELSWSAASFNPSLGWDAVRWQRNPLSVTPSESESEIVANGKAKLSLSLSVSFIHSLTTASANEDAEISSRWTIPLYYYLPFLMARPWNTCIDDRALESVLLDH